MPSKSLVMMTARCPCASSRANTLIHKSMSLPSAGLVREAYPAIQSGCVGVMFARAVPAFHEGGSAASSEPARKTLSSNQTTRERKQFINASFLLPSPSRKEKTRLCRVTFKTRILCAIKTRMLRRSGSGAERWVWLWDQERPAGRRHHRLGADSAGRLNGVRRRWPTGEGRAGLCRRPRRGRAFAGSRRKATKGKLELGAGPIVFRPALG